MSIFSPNRFQMPFLPVRPPDNVFEVAATALERTGKGVLFGCRMCGNCILQETAFVCPMTCAKGLRNGFCGEASENGCVVDPRRKCTWLEIYRRAEQMGRMDRLLEINAPINGAQAGHSAWLPFLAFWRQHGSPALTDLAGNPQRFWEEWDALCLAFRQPAWWQGDGAYHAAAEHAPVSKLEAALRSQSFIVTGEIQPPMDNATGPLMDKVAQLSRHVTSINFSDNAFATGCLSSLACAHLCNEGGGEAVMQIQARDRSRSGVLSEVMGASALGVRNILCLGGDYHNKGTQEVYPAQPGQFDVDGVQIVWMLRRLRDEGRHVDGRAVETRPSYFIGAAGSPFTLKPSYSALRLEKKINAGAQFIQTQMVFDVGAFEAWLEACERRGLVEKTSILAGVYPLRDAADARMMAAEAGILIPQDVLRRMDAAAEKDGAGSGGAFQAAESLAIAVETIEALKKAGGIRGVHLMVGGQEALVPDILAAAGLGV